MKYRFVSHLLVLFTGIALLAGAAYAHPGHMLTEPYLQNVKPNGITIMWEMHEATGARVLYGKDAAYGNTVAATSKDSGHESHIYKAVLTGLEPGTTYHYTVIAESGVATGDATFTTAPGAPQAFSFGVWSDSQGENKGKFPDDPYEPTKKMMAHMAEQDIDIAVTSGDLAEDGGDYKDVRRFFLDRVAKYLGRTVPFFIAWGNHEPERDDIIRQFADLPSKDREGFDPGWGSYSFDYAGCHFVCLDYSTMEQDIKNWLEDDLKSEANQNARYTFLFVHVPPYCEMWIDGDKMLRKKLVPLLEKYGVDAVFSGHTHEYERGYKEHVHYIITGGGSWLDWEEPIVKEWEHMFVGGKNDLAEFKHGLVNEYVIVDVGMEAWNAHMHAFKPNGEYIGIRDEFGSALKDTNGDGLLTGSEREMPKEAKSADEE